MIRLTIIEIIFVLILLVCLPALLITNHPYISNQPENTRLLSLEENNTINFNLQNFQNQSINSLSLQLKNPSILNNSHIFINLSDPNNNLLSSFSFTGYNVGDPSWLNLRFKPLPVQIKYLNVTIATNNQNPESLFIYTDNNSVPVYQTTFRFTNLKENFMFVLKNLYTRFSLMNHFYQIFYVLIILVLNHVITKK